MKLWLARDLREAALDRLGIGQGRRDPSLRPGIGRLGKVARMAEGEQRRAYRRGERGTTDGSQLILDLGGGIHGLGSFL